jgi:hypothetical protein
VHIINNCDGLLDHTRVSQKIWFLILLLPNNFECFSLFNKKIKINLDKINNREGVCLEK